jgi:hypothetical protein
VDTGHRGPGPGVGRNQMPLHFLDGTAEALEKWPDLLGVIPAPNKVELELTNLLGTQLHDASL